jgi:hypothetical protein
MPDIDRDVVCQWYISPIRMSVGLLVALGLAAVLVAQGDTENLTYTGFIFQPSFLWLRTTLILVMLIAICMNIPHLLRAIRHRPSVLASDESIIVRGCIEKTVSVSEIARLEDGGPGTFYLVLKTGRKVGIPTMFFKDASQMKSFLRGLAEPAMATRTEA